MGKKWAMFCKTNNKWVKRKVSFKTLGTNWWFVFANYFSNTYFFEILDKYLIL